MKRINQTMQNVPRPQAGYSLSEALIVITALSVLLSLGLPSLRTVVSRSTLKSAVDRLRSDLGEARNLARDRAQPVYASFMRSSDGASWCWGLSLASGCDCTSDDRTSAAYCFVDRDAATSEPLPRIVRSADYRGVQLDALPFSGSLRMSPIRADLIAGNASFSTPATGDALRVVSSSLGRLRLCSPSGAHAVAGMPSC